LLTQIHIANSWAFEEDYRRTYISLFAFGTEIM